MAEVSSKILIFIGFLCVYIYGIKGRPNNFDDVTAAEDQNKFEESNLLKRSKINSGGQDKGMNFISHTKSFTICLSPYESHLQVISLRNDIASIYNG